jgi:hypothetical protein
MSYTSLGIPNRFICLHNVYTCLLFTNGGETFYRSKAAAERSEFMLHILEVMDDETRNENLKRNRVGVCELDLAGSR